MTDHDVPAAGDPDERERAAQERCPSCGALRPPAVAWCTQCYARFEAPDAIGPPAGAPHPATAGPDGAPAVPAPGLGPAHPVRDDARAPADPAEVEARAAELLARLSSEDGGGDRLRSWSGRFQGRGSTVGLAVGGTLLLTVVLFGAMTVLGALL